MSLFGTIELIRPRQVGASGLSGELASLLASMKERTAPIYTLRADEFINPPAADDDAFILSAATSTSITDLSEAALTGVVNNNVMPFARPVNMTTSDSAPSYQGNATVYGEDVKGRAIQETLAIANNTVATTTKCFKRVSRIVIPAQVDADGAIKFGFGVGLGLSEPIVSLAGAVMKEKEFFNGAVVTNGTVTAAATNEPHGMYTPNTAPNGTHDYGLTYGYSAT
jgi:hypothetical protein